MHSEIKKQLIDQPLHLLMCIASVVGLGSILMLAVGVKVVLATIISTMLTCAWVGLREYIQYPPRETRPWDVWVDAVFEIIGIAGGAVLFYFVIGPLF